MKTRVTNWGNYPVTEAEVISFRSEEDGRRAISAGIPVIPRGLGRCYGDSALGQQILAMTSFNRFLSFDESNGIIVCEAGVSLAEIIQVALPRGFFLPVTPGTKFVTVGGAISSDVHGKNHHVSGCFSRHVVWMDVMIESGAVIRCSETEHPDLFSATAGGMGLTGVILRAAIKLIKVETPFIMQETVKARNLQEVMDAFEQSGGFTYSVAWIDCVTGGNSRGRSILFRGEHATNDDLRRAGFTKKFKDKPKLNVPVYFPEFALNRFTVKAFNTANYMKSPSGTKASVIDYDTFFYPLDAVLNWNRIYGRRGFTQYQFVLPPESSKEGLTTVLKKIEAAGEGSFLAVLKLFGKEEGVISFPREGYNLALDFAISDRTFRLLDELDAIVLDYGGRFYFTKDARMQPETFRRGYPRMDDFLKTVTKYNPNRKFRSLQSERLKL
mgnify:CR=1 FL=1